MCWAAGWSGEDSADETLADGHAHVALLGHVAMWRCNMRWHGCCWAAGSIGMQHQMGALVRDQYSALWSWLQPHADISEVVVGDTKPTKTQALSQRWLTDMVH